ncbi:unnamed protein product [Acanthoscelides obtectus]|uniref:Peptidase S1 domain-containing protein n=1 Tax=Acanthoscelides obtectus TaxID=200917 RepID=A0A9P0PT75_ACAOB|nr:unnamed protein product [Acanthoscelides obtectus]CAK1660816.1 hypothetical protein AOBTE_LOCUS22275 [Acanthoscelides obtectus]
MARLIRILFLACACLLGQVYSLNRNISFPKDVTVSPFTYRIIGGWEARPHYYPFMAAVMITTKDSNFFCGGSLITSQIVLTAAHCLDGNPVKIQVALGRHDLAKREPSGQLYETKSYAIHRHWSRQTLQHDIALIKLPRSATLNQYVKTISLASSLTKLYSGHTIALGWGQTSGGGNSATTKLRVVDVTLMSLQTCQYIYGDDVITRSHICTKGPDLSIKGTCNGDSGGPLVLNGVQIGIVSFGSADCMELSPSVYTNVAVYETWIKLMLNHSDAFSGAPNQNNKLSVYILSGVLIIYTII